MVKTRLNFWTIICFSNALSNTCDNMRFRPNTSELKPQYFNQIRSLAYVRVPKRTAWHDHQITDNQAQAIHLICNSDLELVASKETFDVVLDTQNLQTRALLTLVSRVASKVSFQNFSIQKSRPVDVT